MVQILDLVRLFLQITISLLHAINYTLFLIVASQQALEALRKLRAEKVQEMKEIKLKTDHLRTNKDAAHRLRGDITDLQEKEKTYRHQIRDLEDLISAKDKASLYIIDTITLHLLDSKYCPNESYQAATGLGPLEASTVSFLDLCPAFTWASFADAPWWCKLKF